MDEMDENGSAITSHEFLSNSHHFRCRSDAFVTGVEGLGAECLQEAGAGSGRTGTLQWKDVSDVFFLILL